jgi:hypothetical protein
MFRTKPKDFGVLTNCASVKVGLFFLQICGIKNLVKFPAQLVKFQIFLYKTIKKKLKKKKTT